MTPNLFEEGSVYRTCILSGVAEFLGTAFLMFFGCLGTLTAGTLAGLTFGFAVLASMQMFGHISGAHVNPAVTIAAAILGQIPLIHVPVYFVAQIVGAIAGYGILKACLPEDVPDFCITRPAFIIDEGQAFGIEFIITAILVFCLCAGWEKSNATKNDSLAVRIGLLTGGIFMVASPLTGASLNSARSLAPAIFATRNGFESHWIYWIAPNLSAIVVASFYRFVYRNYTSTE